MKRTPGITSVSSLQTLERQWRHLLLVNRLLYGILPLVALLVVVDCARWSAQFTKPVTPLLPNLEELHRPLVAIPPLELSASLFEPPKPVESKKPVETSQAATQQVQWKLIGVSIGTTKQAFLTDLEGKQSVWVTQGEQLGDFKVKEIRERAVVLETGGRSYEIHL